MDSSLRLPELNGPTFKSGVLLCQTGKSSSVCASIAVTNELCLSNGFPFPQLLLEKRRLRSKLAAKKAVVVDPFHIQLPGW